MYCLSNTRLRARPGIAVCCDDHEAELSGIKRRYVTMLFGKVRRPTELRYKQREGMPLGSVWQDRNRCGSARQNRSTDSDLAACCSLTVIRIMYHMSLPFYGKHGIIKI